MEKAIKIAIENGWKQQGVDAQIGSDGNVYTFGTPRLDDNKALLDPLFWQALFSIGIEETDEEMDKRITVGQKQWQYHWHRFIDHLAEGKDIDSFFKELLTNK